MADADTSLDFLPISERQEWGDVRPLAPPATPQPAVAIGRDLLLGDLMDYFWAAVAAKECRWAGKGRWGLAGVRCAPPPSCDVTLLWQHWLQRAPPQHAPIGCTTAAAHAAALAAHT